MWKTGKNNILNNVDYLWKKINADDLSDNISEVIPRLTINDANSDLRMRSGVNDVKC